MKKSLEALFAPMTKGEFIKHYLNNTPVVAHDRLEHLKELTQLPFLTSLDSLFDTWPTQVTAYMEGIADEGNSKKVTTVEAKELYQKGSGLCFDDVDLFSPLLAQWPCAIRQELGLSQLTYGRSLIYTIKEGEGTAAHFDQNINFVIQISGTKKWWLAPNTHVENPLSRHTIGIDMDPELESYAFNGMPESFPDKSQEFILKPGSILFVPRGYWHKTEAISNAVSLNFTLTAPSWLDLLTATVRARLAQSSEWRETANFVSDDLRYHEAIEKFEILLAQFAHEAKDFKADEILSATESRDPTL